MDGYSMPGFMPTATDFNWGSVPATTAVSGPTMGGFDWSGGSSNFSGWGQNSAAQAPTTQNSFWGKDGFNLGTAGTIAQGIGALANAWMQFQNLKVAKGQLALARDGFELNARNSIQSYNTSLEDRIRGRTADYAGKEGDVQAYLAKNSLHR